MRLPVGLLLALVLLGCAADAAPAAPAAPSWRSEQPPSAAGGHPLLGEIGDVECWHGEANRCLLITAGNGGVAPGIFAYDGSGWYRYSTVCGGHEGRIAWAGPDDFWTISDQQPGQPEILNEEETHAVSLCHFENGQVVASYGEPIGVANSYRKMDAAACAGPADCWFAGARLGEETSVNPGAFHLHWNGSSVEPVPSQTAPSELGDPGRSVSSLAYHGGALYEGVDVEEGDVADKAEEEREAEVPGTGVALLHRIDLAGGKPFQPLFGSEPFNFGPFAEASELGGFLLSGGEEEDLWAVAGSQEAARVTVLRLGPEGPTQLNLEDEAGVLGAETPVVGIAAEPGAEALWVAFRRSGDQSESINFPARLARVEADGAVGPEVQLPLAGDSINGEAVGYKGVASAITCAAPEQCWLATKRGWLFHLGPDPAPQNDPAMHVLITSRPPDESLPTTPPIELPEDDSGAEEGTSGQEELPGQLEELPKRKPPLLSHIKQQLIHEDVLELSFLLRAKAHVQMVAERKGKVVGKTKRYTMSRGRHKLRLRLDPKRWPTKIDLKAKPVKRRGSK